MNTPSHVRIVHPDGSTTPVECEFIGSEPMDVGGDTHIVNRWLITTETFLAEGDRIDGDIPEDCSIIARHVGVR